MLEFVSIKNIDLKYFAITYILGEQECIYFLISADITTAVNYFLFKVSNSPIPITEKDIVKIRTFEIMNPN